MHMTDQVISGAAHFTPPQYIDQENIETQWDSQFESQFERDFVDIKEFDK
jgi:hypothetical protein